MPLYARIADLEIQVDSYRLEGLEMDTGAGWVRKSTVIRLEGTGLEGCGEDVTYQPEDQVRFQELGRDLPLTQRGTFEGFSQSLDAFDLFFGQAPADPAARLYRRWSFESAALDLALQQNGVSLAKALDLPLARLRFVSSLGLGPDGDMKPILTRLDRNPGLEFKVDFAADWSEESIQALADTGAVRTVDLKGQYRGAFQGPPADPRLYRMVAENLKDCWLEDPDWSQESALALAPFEDRITWDAVLHSLADIDQRPNRQRCVNIKPSRFGYVSELMRIYEYCQNGGLQMYSGGQFELGPGRDHIQYLAAMFHPDTPNDAAPRIYNETPLPTELPHSPLDLEAADTGFRFAAH